jgi:hypothetical protein|uniref:Uncharacterized protein n=1 Tax=Podoviridae sp. ct8Lf7 TaxID=2827723 RepID=A0A8S5RZW6_9CAUD|nr:MAG TPA: hypothetical protein [Podoviridae sp. ct8Lf7]
MVGLIQGASRETKAGSRRKRRGVRDARLQGNE